MILWLWQASGPGNFSGITGDEQAACRAVSECIAAGQAQTATVEAASLVLGVPSLADAYRRTGTGWAARRTCRGIYWTPLRATS